MTRIVARTGSTFLIERSTMLSLRVRMQRPVPGTPMTSVAALTAFGLGVAGVGVGVGVGVGRPGGVGRRRAR